MARVLDLVHACGNAEPSTLNMAVADRRRAAVRRFTDHPVEAPESLCFLEGEICEPAGRRFQQRRADNEGVPGVVSSERLTEDCRWTAVHPNHLVVMDRFASPRLFAMSTRGLLLDDSPLSGQPTHLTAQT